VGYFGYEMKSECDSPPCPYGVQTERREKETSGNTLAPPPDAAFIFADRVIAFDHHQREMFLLCLTDDQSQTLSEAESWLNAMQDHISGLQVIASSPAPTLTGTGQVDFTEIIRKVIRDCSSSAAG